MVVVVVLVAIAVGDEEAVTGMAEDGVQAEDVIAGESVDVATVCVVTSTSTEVVTGVLVLVAVVVVIVA